MQPRPSVLSQNAFVFPSVPSGTFQDEALKSATTAEMHPFQPHMRQHVNQTLREPRKWAHNDIYYEISGRSVICSPQECVSWTQGQGASAVPSVFPN